MHADKKGMVVPIKAITTSGTNSAFRSFRSGVVRFTSPTVTALIEAAHAAARDIVIDVTIAITDSAGHLKAFDHSDKAPFFDRQSRK